MQAPGQPARGRIERDPAVRELAPHRAGEPAAKRLRIASLLRQPRGRMDEPAREAVDALHSRFLHPLLRASPARGKPAAGRAHAAWRSGTTSVAAPVGVAARTSATKSQIVKSVSWPTAETTGSADAWTACATTSSLNAHRSSIEPPPRPTISTSTSARSFAVRIAPAISAAAPSPWTAVG